MARYGIECPSCGSTNRTVAETRKQRGYIRRRCHCLDCPMAYTTEERCVIDSDAIDRQQKRILLEAGIDRAMHELKQMKDLLP